MNDIKKLELLDALTDKLVNICSNCDDFPCDLSLDIIGICTKISIELTKEPEPVKKRKLNKLNIVWQN